jgi:hypothetical protein
MKQSSTSISFLGVGLLCPFVLGPVLLAMLALVLVHQWVIAGWTAVVAGSLVFGILYTAHRYSERWAAERRMNRW